MRRSSNPPGRAGRARHVPLTRSGPALVAQDGDVGFALSFRFARGNPFFEAGSASASGAARARFFLFAGMASAVAISSLCQTRKI